MDRSDDTKRADVDSSTCGRNLHERSSTSDPTTASTRISSNKNKRISLKVNVIKFSTGTLGQLWNFPDIFFHSTLKVITTSAVIHRRFSTSEEHQVAEGQNVQSGRQLDSIPSSVVRKTSWSNGRLVDRFISRAKFEEKKPQRLQLKFKDEFAYLSWVLQGATVVGMCIVPEWTRCGSRSKRKQKLCARKNCIRPQKVATGWKNGRQKWAENSPREPNKNKKKANRRRNLVHPTSHRK